MNLISNKLCDLFHILKKDSEHNYERMNIEKKIKAALKSSQAGIENQENSYKNGVLKDILTEIKPQTLSSFKTSVREIKFLSKKLVYVELLIF